jgi:hypothetical protein
MQRSSQPRHTAYLSDSLHQQLTSYALAAGAAGVSVLALAQPTEAKIKYTPTHVVIGGNQNYNLDLNRDGIADFVIQNADYNGYCSGRPWKADDLSPKPGIKGNGVIARFSSFASALYKGAQIGQSRNFQSSFNPMVQVASGYVPSFRHKCLHVHNEAGPWLNVSNRYLGLRFKIRGKTHYGWARLSVQAGFVFINATLNGYAYETIAGKSIKAGQTKGMANDPTNDDFGASLSSPIPEAPHPATLGALAMGAPGMSIWRRKEAMGAAQ